MRDDHKYSLERVVFYRHPDPLAPFLSYGESGPERTCGAILAVTPNETDPASWVYRIRNWFNGETREVPEDDIYCGANHTHRRGRGRNAPAEPETGSGAVLKSNLASFVRTSISHLKELEEREEAARAQGSDLPVQAGDYIRVSGEFRKEIEPYHGFYAKVLEVSPADVGALELDPERWAGTRTHKVRKRYSILTEDGGKLHIYDPEIGRYYTTTGRTRILNWRAAAFLAEIFGETPPYHVDYDFLESHLFMRAELAALSREQLTEILINLLYVKGQLGLPDEESQRQALSAATKGYLVDNILFASRFDMRRNRPMTREEVLERLAEEDRLRAALEG